MSVYLGLDTSNYTTSAAFYDDETGELKQEKKLLPVQAGAVGLRQSDAVFSHVKQLSEVIGRLFENNSTKTKVSGVCVSTRPRSVEGSYMPCFLVGRLVAESLSAVMQIPLAECSHQEGHIAAALYSAGKLDWLNKGQKFYAFHVSGGTTEALLVKPNSDLFEIELVAQTLDLNAGQLIDRAGVLLGLPFPCGVHLDKLSLECDENIRVSASMKGASFHLSGVQNQVEKLHMQGKGAAYISKFVLESIGAAIIECTKGLIKAHGKLPILYAGGVMSNTLLRKKLSSCFECHFAEPAFSADNAAGAAVIGKRRIKQEN